jgi:hypothetical protein
MRHAHRSIRHCQTVGDARHPSTTCQVRTHLPRSAAHCRSDDPALITGARDSRSCQESSEVSVIRTWTTRPSLGVGVPACQPGVLRAGDQLGHGRLGHAHRAGPRPSRCWPAPSKTPSHPRPARWGGPAPAVPAWPGSRPRSGQPVRRAGRAEQPDQPLHPGRYPGRQRLSLRPARNFRKQFISSTYIDTEVHRNAAGTVPP